MVGLVGLSNFFLFERPRFFWDTLYVLYILFKTEIIIFGGYSSTPPTPSPVPTVVINCDIMDTTLVAENGILSNLS